MRNDKRIFAGIGFVIGFAFGSGMSYLAVFFMNWLFPLFGKEPVSFTLWSLLPMGVLVGLSVAINVANPPFGD